MIWTNEKKDNRFENLDKATKDSRDIWIKLTSLQIKLHDKCAHGKNELERIFFI